VIRNFFKIAFRNLLKYKTYSIVNILGLAVGLASCIIILLFVSYELSYDRHLPDHENIYRVTTRGIVGENNFHMALTPPPMAHTLVKDFPEVKNAARLMRTENMLIRANDNTNIFIESNFYWADSTFFDVFKYKMIYGDVRTALNEPHSVVLTARLAEKVFR
jgi:putative ABC transport system permease protein